jgi:hypothetical protein
MTRRPIVFACLGLFIAASASIQAPAAEMTQVFRGRSYDPQLFKPTGNTAKALKPEAEGLRITISPEQNSKMAVGFVPKFGLRGDFEITLAFDIIRVDKPTTGYGAGVSIWIRSAAATDEAATIWWAIGTDGEQAFLSHGASTPVGGKRKHSGGKPLATEARSGKLRLVRSGPIVSYLVAEGDSYEFRQVYQRELGTEDLEIVRFAADNGGSPTMVDVRLKSLAIRADEFPGEVKKQTIVKRKRWPLWLAVGLLGAILAAGGGWWWWRKSRQRTIASALADSMAQPAAEKARP